MRAARASTPAPRKARGLCQRVPARREIGQIADLPARSRDADAARFQSMIMQINEAMLSYQVLNFDAADRLATTRQVLAYLTDGVPDTGEESFWIACMNPNRRPICRTRLKIGPLVASRVTMRDVFLPLMLAEAKTFACLRVQPGGAVEPNLADGRLLWNLRETARLLNIEIVDYLITSLDGRAYHSWRETARRGE